MEKFRKIENYHPEVDMNINKTITKNNIYYK